MEFGKPRIFTNEFSEELNGCYENECDGVLISIARFKYFQKSVIAKIESDNKIILSNLNNEEYEVANSMRNQFDNSTKLDFFIEHILKSNIVAIYSYFEFKVGEISTICEKNIHPKKKIKSFTKGSYIEKYNSFLISEIIPDLTVDNSLFKELSSWTEIRNGIVHNNSTLKTKNNILRFKNGDDIIKLLDIIEEYLNIIISLINSKYDLINYICFQKGNK